MRLKLYRGKWAAVWTEGGRTRRSSFSTPDRADAEIAFEEFKHKRKQAAVADRPRTIGAAIRAYLDAKPEIIDRPGLVEWWKSKLPDHLTKATVKEYALFRKGKSPSTIRTELGIVLTALHWAGYKDAAIEEMPAGSPPRERWITRDEAERLIESAKSPHMKLFIMLAVYTGARTGAILGLTWDRVSERFIDFNDPEKPTSRKRRAVVTTHPELWQALLEARPGALSPYVVEYGGERIGSVKKAFQRVAKLAKLKGVGPHTIRHSVATWMAADGVPFAKIGAVLGNSEKMAEKVYAKFAPDYLKDAIQSLSRGRPVQVNQKVRGKARTVAKTRPKRRKRSK